MQQTKCKRNRGEHQPTLWQAKVLGPLFHHQPTDLSQQTETCRQTLHNPANQLQLECLHTVAVSVKTSVFKEWVLTVPKTTSNNFWSITNMHVQQTTVYVCKKSTPAVGKITCGAHLELGSL